jgi:glutamate formiminotransferase/formiminotetrahydrofolate cyclodeaminase
VGLIPLQAMLDAGYHYINLQGSSPGVPEADVIETAIQSMGLREVAPFDPQEKIIEYRVAKDTPLANMTVAGFVDLTSTDAPAPGGGSVAALLGSLSGALTSMVANLTIGKKRYAEVEEEMMRHARAAQELKARFVKAIDDDTNAFDGVIAAMRLPKDSDLEKAERERAIQEATKEAIEVPFGVLRDCREVLAAIEPVAQKGNTNSISDAGVAAMCLRGAAGGAYLNVIINLPGVDDADYKTKMVKEATAILDEVRTRADAVVEMITTSLLDQVS